MKADQAFTDLVGHIYDCALDTALWPSVLGEIAEAVGGRIGDLIVSHPLERTQRVAVHYNWPEELIALAQANAHLNPAMPLGLTAPLCEPMCSTRDIDIEAFHRSRYWLNCYAHFGLYDYVVAPITRTVPSFATWGVLGYRSVAAGTLQAALDALSAATLIVQPDGAILFCNTAADEELARRQVIREHSGRLLGVTPDAVKFLSSLAMAETRNRLRGLDAQLIDRSGRTLHMTWAVLDRAEGELGSPLLLLLREPDAILTTPLTTATELFHLTPSETQVLHGRTLIEIAEILGVARSTVKSHLEAIFRKTRTSRQSELVRLTVGLASPLLR